MRILKVEPGKAPCEKEIENNLDTIQQEVGGGLFQVLYILPFLVPWRRNRGFYQPLLRKA